MIEYMNEFYDDVKVLGKISELYPGLLDLTWDGNEVSSIYFKDRSICNEPLRVFDYFGNNGNFVKISFEVVDMGKVYLRLILNLQGGIVHMFEDLGIPEESCVGLYNQNITISYGSAVSPIEYDREDIMRRHTINNIIN